MDALGERRGHSSDRTNWILEWYNDMWNFIDAPKPLPSDEQQEEDAKVEYAPSKSGRNPLNGKLSQWSAATAAILRIILGPLNFRTT